MAQEDYSIADQTGASFLVDLNAQLAAIASNNSGATAPSTTFAYQWWADTTTGLLKIRNAANSAWITIGTLASANLGLAAVAGSSSQNFSALNLSAAGTLAVAGIATFTGAPVGPTQAGTDDSTKLATTAHVLNRLQLAPAFRAAQSVTQSLTSATPTKINFGTEEFDTNSNFASSRFTPTVAGYYQINWGVSVTGTAMTDGYASIYQNGSEVERGTEVAANSGSSVSIMVSRGAAVLTFNGSTDYAEVFAKFTGSSLSAGFNRFSGCLIRPL